MAYADLEKAKAAQLRYRTRKHAARYGENAGNMSGRHGNHAKGANNARWKGGRFITSHGYVAVRVEPHHPHAWGAHPRVRYAYEHILVAEQSTGRRLRDDEVVHHINHDKTDNRPENLQILARKEHAKEHDDLRGRDELGRFPPDDIRVREFPEVA